MSAPPPPPPPERDPALDPGVLDAGPLVEVGGWHAVARQGGAAVLRWRALACEAAAAGVPVAPGAEASPAGWPQALVRISRGQEATAADLHESLARLPAGAALTLTGANGLGIGGWIRRVAAVLGPPLAVSARAHARAARFAVPAGARWPAPDPVVVPLPLLDGGAVPVQVAPGIFAGGTIDAGTRLLLTHLAETLPAQPLPAAIIDLGCGAGHLGLAAALAAPGATLGLLDGDARACACAQGNADRLGLGARTQVRWWDVQEPVGLPPADLVVCNPPAHAGAAVDLAGGQAMLRALGSVLAPGGRALVVANLRLPWEQELARIGPCRLAREAHGYKILEVRRGGGGHGGSA